MIPGMDSRYWDGNYPHGYDYKFIYIKVTEGKNFTPGNADVQTEGAKKAGMLRGYYHFYRFWHSAADQAQWFYDNTPKDADLPPVIDLEDRLAPRGLQNVNKIKLLCDTVEELFGRKPMIYTAAWWWNPWIYPYIPASGWDYNAHDLWVANYTGASSPYMPQGWNDWQVWQHIGDWKAPGFNATIDVNRAKEEWYNQFTGTQPADPKEGIKKELNCIKKDVSEIENLLEDL